MVCRRAFLPSCGATYRRYILDSSRMRGDTSKSIQLVSFRATVQSVSWKAAESDTCTNTVTCFSYRTGITCVLYSAQTEPIVSIPCNNCVVAGGTLAQAFNKAEHGECHERRHGDDDCEWREWFSPIVQKAAEMGAFQDLR